MCRGSNPYKSPDYDLIIGKELGRKCVLFLTFIFNAMLRLDLVPVQCKRAQLIVIPIPDKPLNQLNSSRLISLSPVISKVFEKFFLKRLRSLNYEQVVVPDHHLDFIQKDDRKSSYNG